MSVGLTFDIRPEKCDPFGFNQLVQKCWLSVFLRFHGEFDDFECVAGYFVRLFDIWAFNNYPEKPLTYWKYAYTRASHLTVTCMNKLKKRQWAHPYRDFSQALENIVLPRI